MKQAGRIWNKTLDTQMIAWGFTRLACESCVYIRKTDSGVVIAVIHVDDFLSVSNKKEENERFKEQMRKVWKISDLGTVKHLLGIAVSWDRPNRLVKLSQTALIDKIISQFGQCDATPLSLPMQPGLKLQCIDRSTLSREELDRIQKLPYRSLIGCLLYLATGTRPDIAFAVQQLSQFLDSYTEIHWNAAIRLVRYLKGTRDLKLHLGGTNQIELLGFTDSDHANAPDRRSVGGYGWSLGSGLCSWSVKKQKTVASSTCEAEYVAAFEASRECIWLRMLLKALNMPRTSPTRLLCDNQAAISLSEDPTLHQRVKHIDIKYHFLREQVQMENLELRYIPSRDNIADIFTKPLKYPNFIRLRSFTGLRL